MTQELNYYRIGVSPFIALPEEVVDDGVAVLGLRRVRREVAGKFSVAWINVMQNKRPLAKIDNFFSFKLKKWIQAKVNDKVHKG